MSSKRISYKNLTTLFFCILLVSNLQSITGNALRNIGMVKFIGNLTISSTYLSMANLFDISREISSATDLQNADLSTALNFLHLSKIFLDSTGIRRDYQVIHLFFNVNEVFRSAVSFDGNNSDWECIYSGLAFRIRGELENATAVWQHCREISKLYYHLGLDYFSRDQLNQAIDNLRFAILIDPGYIDAYYLLGRTYRIENRWIEALILYRNLRSIDTKNPGGPEDMWGLLKIGHLFREQGNSCKNATFWYELAKQKFPNSEYPYIYLGVCEDQFDQKIQSFKRATELNQRNYLGYYWLGESYKVKGELSIAKYYLEKAVALLPKDKPDLAPLFTLADTYRELYLYDSSLAVYEAILQVDRTNSRALNEINVIQKEKYSLP